MKFSIGGFAILAFMLVPILNLMMPPGHPLLAAPNTVLTPHLGYVAGDNYAVYFADVAEDIRAFLEGEPVRVLS